LNIIVMGQVYSIQAPQFSVNEGDYRFLEVIANERSFQDRFLAKNGNFRYRDDLVQFDAFDDDSPETVNRRTLASSSTDYGDMSEFSTARDLDSMSTHVPRSLDANSHEKRLGSCSFRAPRSCIQLPFRSYLHPDDQPVGSVLSWTSNDMEIPCEGRTDSLPTKSTSAWREWEREGEGVESQREDVDNVDELEKAGEEDREGRRKRKRKGKRKEFEDVDTVDELQQAKEIPAEEKLASFLTKRGFSTVNSRPRKYRHRTFPLHRAVRDYDTEMIQILLANGADINRTGGKKRKTPLQVAVDIGNIEAVRLLQAVSNKRSAKSEADGTEKQDLAEKALSKNREHDSAQMSSVRFTEEIQERRKTKLNKRPEESLSPPSKRMIRLTTTDSEGADSRESVYDIDWTTEKIQPAVEYFCISDEEGEEEEEEGEVEGEEWQ